MVPPTVHRAPEVATRRHGHRADGPPRSWLGRGDAPFLVALLFLLVAFVARAGRLPLFEWDESRNVMNAFEMARGGDWLALHFGGELDHWNLKPPLFIWILAAIFRWVGYSESWARLPAVLFGLASALLVYRFIVRHTGDRPVATLASLGLVTCTGFYGFHGLTSADVDAALVFFATVAFVAIHDAVLDGRPRALWTLGASLGLGFMVKSLAGLLPLVALVPALVLEPYPRRLVNRHAAGGLALLALLTLPWLIARSRAHPDGYLGLMIGVDVLRRVQTVVEQHAGDAWFYYRWAVRHLGAWLYAAFGAAVSTVNWLARAGWDARAATLRTPWIRAALMATGTAVLYGLAFSASASKLSWYMFPAYPLVFVVLGLGVSCAMPFYARRLRVGLLALMVAANLVQIVEYERVRATGVDIVDALMFPLRERIRHHALLTSGDLHQNGFVLAAVYSDLQVSNFAAGEPLDGMLATRPRADFLIAADGRPYLGDPRLRPIRIAVRPGTLARPALFEVVHP